MAQSNNNRFIISHGYCGPGNQGWAQLGSSGSGSHEVVVRWRLVLEQHGTELAGGWPSTSLSLHVVSEPFHVTASCVIAGFPNSTVVITQSHHQYPRWAGQPEADGSPMTFDPCIFASTPLVHLSSIYTKVSHFMPQLTHTHFELWWHRGTVSQEMDLGRGHLFLSFRQLFEYTFEFYPWCLIMGKWSKQKTEKWTRWWKWWKRYGLQPQAS